MNIENSLKLIELFSSSNADKLHYKEGEYSIYIEASKSAKIKSVRNNKKEQNNSQGERRKDKKEVNHTSTVLIVSPYIGIFHDGGNKERLPYVFAGDKVKEGQLVCLVEGVQGMEEVHSPKDGVITAIHVANGERVEYGRGLFSLKVEESEDE